MPELIRLTEIDATNIDLHPRLTADDKCFFLFEYTSGKGYGFSSTNSLISNLKKKPDANGQGYKAAAINECATTLRRALNDDWLKQATLVPVPPSKAVGDPMYDNRMERICTTMGAALDVRLLVRQTVSMAAAHELAPGARPSVEDLLEVYEINEALTTPLPKMIGVFDDVLTAGTHYRAMKSILTERFPSVPIYGFFIARRVFATPDFEV